MAIPSRQIGQPSSTKAQLLWNISKQLETLIKVAGNVYIPQCPANTWTFTAGNTSIFPSSSDGYTLYEGNWTNYDDGQTSDPFPLAGDFYTDGGTADNTAYMSTNGFMIASSTGFDIYGNQGDLYLTPGQPLDDGDTQNFWYQNTGNSTKWKTSMLIYCGRCCGSPNQQTPYSYILNIYRDTDYQYIEACAKTNFVAGAGPESNMEDASTETQVWRGDLNGDAWIYLGFGTIN